MQSGFALFFRSFFLTLAVSICLLNPSVGADYEYTLRWLSPNTHTYVIEATVATQFASYTDFVLPAWRPGRYYLQDYAGAVSHFEARDGKNQPLKWHKINTNTWRVIHGQLDQLTVSYRYFANNQGAGSSYFNTQEIYFNPVNLFMFVPGRYGGNVELRIPDLPPSWKAATALSQSAHGIYTAESYHEFADSPTVFSPKMEQFSFKIDQTTFYVHFQGDYQGNEKTEEAVSQALSSMCKEQAAIFGGFPFDEFHFIYRLLPYRMRHAVEHAKSASFALPANISQTPEKTVAGIMGISSHEFWHVWNVKRIRPAALWPYDYSAPQYTSLHWFTEGVTSYYTHLTLLRAGLYTEENFLQQQSNTIESLENSYASYIVSPSASSFDSWLDASPYKHPDHQISYYTLGHRVGLLLDLSLRARTDGKTSLDDVFRYLFQTYYQQQEGVPEDGIQKAMETLTGQSWQDFFDAYVHGAEPINYQQLFDPFGLELTIKDSRAGSRALGILRSEEISQGLLVRKVSPGSDAYHAGLGENDLILEVDGQQIEKISLDEYLSNLKIGDQVNMKVISYLSMKEITIEYKAAFSPKKFRLAPAGKRKKKQNELYKAWISSQQ
ncbi:MAG: PDZ domain-containing protein [Bacteroidota bacterium]